MQADFTAEETTDLTRQLMGAVGRLLLDGPSRAAQALTENFTEDEIRAISIANRIDDVLNTAEAAQRAAAAAGQPTVAVAPPVTPEVTPATIPTAAPLLASGGSTPEIDLEAQALALLFQHGDWSIAQIAKHLGVGRQTPYGWPKFRQAAELRGILKPRSAKDRTRPRGHKTSDGRVEAYADEDEDE